MRFSKLPHNTIVSGALRQIDVDDRQMTYNVLYIAVCPRARKKETNNSDKPDALKFFFFLKVPELHGRNVERLVIAQTFSGEKTNFRCSWFLGGKIKAVGGILFPPVRSVGSLAQRGREGNPL